MSSTNNSQRRRALAQAMGVDYWVARKPLVGARPHLCYPPKAEVIVPDVVSSTDAEYTSGGKTPAADLRAAVNQPSLSPASVQMSRSLESAVSRDLATIVPARLEESAANQSPSEAFTLIALQSDHVLMIDDVGDMQLTPSAYVKWVNSVLAVLNVADVSPQRISQARFAWPPQGRQQQPQYAKLDLGMSINAQKVFSAWLTKMLLHADKPPSTIVLMGEAASRSLGFKTEFGVPVSLELTQIIGDSLPSSANMERLYENGSLQCSARALLTLPTAELWQKPSAKAIFWSHLQALLTL